MVGYFKLSNYQFGVLVMYAVLVPLLFIFYPGDFLYSIGALRWGSGLTAILAAGLILSFICRRIGLLNFEKRPVSFLPATALLIYSLIIAVPEEIIFRGFIQGYFQVSSENLPAAILLSSLIFGLAHLPNGASGLHPRRWNWYFAGLAFCGGFFFGLLFAATGSLLYSTIFHAFILVIFGLYRRI